MNLEAHWERVYHVKRPDEVSWFRPHLDTSLALIRESGIALSQPIIDVGGGVSTLVDDLLAAGYQSLTVLDLSAAALGMARTRLADRADDVNWIVGDIRSIDLPPAHFRLWHDRAVFHFLVDASDRDRYVAQVRRSLTLGGYVIIGSFGPEGPERCSGLPTARYDAESLHSFFGDTFALVSRREEWHLTPAGKEQQFVYCLCRKT